MRIVSSLAPDWYSLEKSRSFSNETYFRYPRETSLGATRRSRFRRSLLPQPVETLKPNILFSHTPNAIRSQTLCTGQKCRMNFARTACYISWGVIKTRELNVVCQNAQNKNTTILVMSPESTRCLYVVAEYVPEAY